MSDYSIYNGAYTGPEVDAAIARARAGGQIDQNITALRAAVGSPLKASTVAGMTDHSRVYVYTGTETGYTAGHWYYWSGTAWTDGGVYNSTAFDTDDTLSIPGEAADAAAVGAAIEGLEDIIAPAYDPTKTYAVGDYCIYSGDLYRCKTAITTAESWTAAHWAAVQVMPEQATAIGDLKSQIEQYNSYDMLREFGTFTSRESGGVVYTWNADKTICTAVGTTTATSVTYLYNDNSLPSGMKVGGTYRVEVDTSDANLLFEIESYNGSTLLQDLLLAADRLYTVPANATRVRLRIRTRYTSGTTTTVNATISVKIINALPNLDLQAELQRHDNMITDIENAISKEKDYVDYALKTVGLIIPSNLFDKNHSETGYTDGWMVNSVIDEDTGEPRSTTSNIATSYMMRVFDKKKVSLKYGNSQESATLHRVAAYDKDGSMIDRSTANLSEYAIPESAYYIRVEYSYGSNSSILSNKITISDDATVGTKYTMFFEPYNGDTIQTSYIQIFPKFTTIGDSLMGGYMKRGGITVNTATAKEAGNNWVNYLALRIGRAFMNLAIGGSTTGDWRTTHISTANIDTDCYLIGLGVNDHRQSVSIGSASDIADNFADNANSFYGNYDYIIRQLMAWNTAAHIFCFTIPAIEGGTSSDYNVAIRAITALYPSKVHCIDLAADYAGYFSNPIAITNFTGGHFNPVAYNYFSQVIEKAINTFMRDNDTLFATAPYA